jgi:hypothetical protein
MRVRLPNGQELILHLLRISNLSFPFLTIDSMMEISWVLPILRQVLMKSSTEMQAKLHGSSTPMSHQALNSTPSEFQMFLRSSQVLVSPRVELSLRSLVPGSTTSHNTVLFHTASLETPLSVLTLTQPSDLSANHQLAPVPTPNLTSRCPSMVLTGPTPTSLLHTSTSQK